jgi:hypothetical protein
VLTVRFCRQNRATTGLIGGLILTLLSDVFPG